MFNREYLKERETNKLSKDLNISHNMKVVITDTGLDHWLAQQYNLTLDTIPPTRPQNIPVFA